MARVKIQGIRRRDSVSVLQVIVLKGPAKLRLGEYELRHSCFENSLREQSPRGGKPRLLPSSPQRPLQVTQCRQSECSATLPEAMPGQWWLDTGHLGRPHNGGGECCVVSLRQRFLKLNRKLGSLHTSSTGCSALDISASTDMDTSKEVRNSAQVVEKLFIGCVVQMLLPAALSTRS